MITFIDTLSATCQRMNDKKDCEPIAICNQTKYNEEKKEAISMARTANVFARVEPEVKEQAEQVLDRLGIPMSNAVGMFLRQIVLQRGIPFEMKLPASFFKQNSGILILPQTYIYSSIPLYLLIFNRVIPNLKAS